jgi:hypothetical protein
MLVEKSLMQPIKKKNSTTGSIFNNDNQYLFREINLQEIFSSETVDNLLNDPMFYMNKNNSLTPFSDDSQEYDDEISKSLKSNTLYERNSLILKFLRVAIDKLNMFNQQHIAKGLEWYIRFFYNFH